MAIRELKANEHGVYLRGKPLGSFRTLLSHLPERTEKSWYVLYTRSNQERNLTDEIRSNGGSCFLPLQPRIARRGGSQVRAATLLLPGFVFLFAGFNLYADIRKSRFIAPCGFPVTESVRCSFERDLLILFDASRHLDFAGFTPRATLIPQPSLTPGELVEIAEPHAMAGTIARVVRRVSTVRIAIDIIMVGSVEFTIDQNFLRLPRESKC